MVKEDTDIIHTTKSDKKTLLERYNIPVEHLSYEYISECTNAKKLERIVHILRSGEEGYYPDLIRHAEQCLAVVKPTSIILRKTEPVLKRSMLDPKDYKEIDKDINDWMSQMQVREKDLAEGKNTLIDPVPQPEIRQFSDDSIKKNSMMNLKNAGNKGNRIASCDYDAWDKYDVDTELNKIDIEDEQISIEGKKYQEKQKKKLAKTKFNKDSVINKSSLTGIELDVMAEQEREKGNEAFRAGDYEEALQHYNTSVKMNSTIVTYNNRAMTHIKLRRYEDALNDCNLVLSVEYTNIKALLRRAVALEHLQKSSQALVDYEAVLKLEPNNAVAIAGVKKLRKPSESRKVRMTIEEQSEEKNEDVKYSKNELQMNYNTQFSSKMILGSNICYCDRAPGPSQNLIPQPHIKADYCLENENNTVKKTKSKNTSELTKTSVSSSHANKTLQNQNNSIRQKSIFSYTMPPKRSSSVIIEELPNEPNNNKCASNKNKAKGSVENNDNSNINACTSKCKLLDDKGTKISSAKNLGKENLQSGGFSERLCSKSSPKKIQVADKYDNKTSKEEKYIPKNFSNIESGYEFMRAWRSLKNDTDLKGHAQLLRAINTDKINLVLGNELDGNMFSIILHCLEQHFCTSNDLELLNNFLRSFCQTKRFSIVHMFMSAEDKRAVKNILNFLEENGTSGISSLRQIYSI